MVKNSDKNLEGLNDIFCETLPDLNLDGVEFTRNDSEKLFESEVLVDFVVHFYEKNLKTPIIDALQKVINALGSVLHICVEMLVYSVLSDEEFIKNIEFDTIRRKAIEKSIYKYIIKNKDEKNLLVMASPYQEAIYKSRYDIYNLDLPLCKDKEYEEEKIDIKSLKFNPPFVGGAFGVLKKKLLEFFQESLYTALQNSFSTDAFGDIISKWSNHKNTKDLFKQQFELIKLDGSADAINVNIDNCSITTNTNADHFKQHICNKKEYFIPSKKFINNVKYKRQQ